VTWGGGAFGPHFPYFPGASGQATGEPRDCSVRWKVLEVVELKTERKPDPRHVNSLVEMFTSMTKHFRHGTS
jgi:hypothetical protein